MRRRQGLRCGSPQARQLRHAPDDERAHCDAMTVRFEHETRIEAPAKLVFDLSLDIYAHRALMAASNERATAGVTSGRIGLGETVTRRAIHFRIPFTMTSRVTELERPHCFIDEQVRGPFRVLPRASRRDSRRCDAGDRPRSVRRAPRAHRADRRARGSCVPPAEAHRRPRRVPQGQGRATPRSCQRSVGVSPDTSEGADPLKADRSGRRGWSSCRR